MERVKASESDLIEKFKTEKRIEHAQNGAAKRNRKRMRERDRKNAVDVSKLQSIDVILLLLFAILFIS